VQQLLQNWTDKTTAIISKSSYGYEHERNVLMKYI